MITGVQCQLERVFVFVFYWIPTEGIQHHPKKKKKKKKKSWGYEAEMVYDIMLKVG